MGEYLITIYNIPMKEQLMSDLIENPIDWYHVGYMPKSHVQSEQSYLEHNMAPQICREIIDAYCNIMTQTNFTKSVVIRGHSGTENAFCMFYISLYNI